MPRYQHAAGISVAIALVAIVVAPFVPDLLRSALRAVGA
jgi:hypothetical protein